MTDPVITWQDKVEKVRSAGVLGMQLYVIFTTPTNGLGPILDNMGPHLDYQKKLESDGVLFAAGPFSDDEQKTWQGDGMVIVRAASPQDASAIAVADPMHIAGARTFRVRPWLLNEGSMTVTLNYSQGGGREIS